MAKRSTRHPWQFKRRFRRHAFGWRSQSAISRVREAVSEIKKAARKDPALAAEGAVEFLERVSPALEHVYGSSGAIGTAVNGAIESLVPIIAKAPADSQARADWMERLFVAHSEDAMPYIEQLADHWGELCASAELASSWADRLLDITTRALSPDREPGEFFHGSSACLSALFACGRYEEILEIAAADVLWHYKCWAARALVELGRHEEAVRYAEACRSSWASDHDIDQHCEAALLRAGDTDGAYQRYGLRANARGTYLAWFRAIVKRYPHRTPREVLADLVEHTPSDEGKWFAAAKDAGLLDEAIELATRSPCDPRTLARAARDFADKNAEFAIEAGIAAIRWLADGQGYEITSADVDLAVRSTLAAADKAHRRDAVLERLRLLLGEKTPTESFVRGMIRSRTER